MNIEDKDTMCRVQILEVEEANEWLDKWTLFETLDHEWLEKVIWSQLVMENIEAKKFKNAPPYSGISLPICAIVAFEEGDEAERFPTLPVFDTTRHSNEFVGNDVGLFAFGEYDADCYNRDGVIEWATGTLANSAIDDIEHKPLDRFPRHGCGNCQWEHEFRPRN
ncbi:hypothetical protein SUGI_0500620 [Cryptomeria japonica]|nr:hypothetical protein SUGI_0500620 [Cryptomeria japonica]